MAMQQEKPINFIYVNNIDLIIPTESHQGMKDYREKRRKETGKKDAPYSRSVDFIFELTNLAHPWVFEYLAKENNRPFVSLKRVGRVQEDDNRLVRVATVNVIGATEEMAIGACREVSRILENAPVRLVFLDQIQTAFGKDILITHNMKTTAIQKQMRQSSSYASENGGLTNGPKGREHADNIAQNKINRSQLWHCTHS